MKSLPVRHLRVSPIPTEAPSPSGKAEVCKTSTPGSNPGGASNFPKKSEAHRSAGRRLVGHCAQIVPVRIGIGGELYGLHRVELLRGFDEIAFTDDVVALEYRARLVPGHLHRNALGYSGAHQVSHRRSSKVMRNPAGAARLRACLSPCLRESHDRLAFDLLACPVKHPGAEHALRSQAVMLGLLSLQELL